MADLFTYAGWVAGQSAQSRQMFVDGYYTHEYFIDPGSQGKPRPPARSGCVTSTGGKPGGVSPTIRYRPSKVIASLCLSDLLRTIESVYRAVLPTH